MEDIWGKRRKNWGSISEGLKLILVISLVSESRSSPVTPKEDAPPGFHIELIRSINESVNPCDDFYEYACGNWEKHHSPPDGYIIWSNLAMIRRDAKQNVKRLVERADSKSDSEATGKMRKVYRACMDTVKIEQVGIAPLISLINDYGGWPLLMERNEWHSKNLTWQKVHSELSKNLSINSLYDIEVITDPNNSSITRISISEPNFLINKKQFSGPRDELTTVGYLMFKRSVIESFQRASSTSKDDPSSTPDDSSLYYDYESDFWSSNNEHTPQLMNCTEFEKTLVRITAERYDVGNIYDWHNSNIMTIDDLQKIYDSSNMSHPTAKIDWLNTVRDLFATVDADVTINGSEEITVRGKVYFSKLAGLLNNASDETIVNYIMWKAIAEMSLYVSDELRDIFVRLEASRVNDNPVSREEQCMDSSQMKRAISYAFVKEYFSAESKQAAIELVENVQEEMKTFIRQSNWTDEIKQISGKQIESLIKLIGYPDDYHDTNIDDFYSEFLPTDSYFENEIRRRDFLIKRNFRGLKEPDNIKRKALEPSSVGAQYAPLKNAILIPAGILQYPIFDLNQPSVFNYGMSGAIIGHELSHALDLNGRRITEDGIEITWGLLPTADKYEEHAKCFIEQYNNYNYSYNSYIRDEYVTSRVNGTQTLAENVADTTGLQVTWEAYKKLREKRGKNGDSNICGLERFNDDQIFFLAFGNTWCAYESNFYRKRLVPGIVHSPAKARVNGAVSNIPAFADAFNCPSKSSMTPLHRCNIWK